jgi:hypothetical protein
MKYSTHSLSKVTAFGAWQKDWNGNFLYFRSIQLPMLIIASILDFVYYSLWWNCNGVESSLGNKPDILETCWLCLRFVFVYINKSWSHLLHHVKTKKLFCRVQVGKSDTGNSHTTLRGYSVLPPVFTHGTTTKKAYKNSKIVTRCIYHTAIPQICQCCLILHYLMIVFLSVGSMVPP